MPIAKKPKPSYTCKHWPSFLYSHGAECAKKHKSFSSKDKHELAASLCKMYVETQSASVLHELFDCVFLYISGIPAKSQAFLRGHSIQEVMSEAYILLPRTATRFKPEMGVPFLVYFIRDLAGRLLSIEVKNRKQDRLLVSGLEYEGVSGVLPLLDNPFDAGYLDNPETLRDLKAQRPYGILPPAQRLLWAYIALWEEGQVVSAGKLLSLIHI